MKTLYIIRHAKSSWDDLSLDDFDRPLNDRGRRDAPRMAKRLKEESAIAGIVITSPAKRAKTTCEIIVSTLGFTSRINEDHRLYHASAEAILKVISEVSDTFNNLMIFGHNPGLTDFANEYCEPLIDNIPTCGIVALQFNVVKWKDISETNAKLLFFDYPKKKAN